MVLTFLSEKILFIYYGGANFVSIAVPSFWWYISFPSSKQFSVKIILGKSQRELVETDWSCQV